MKDVNIFTIILWLIIFSVTSSLLIVAWPVIFIVGGGVLLLSIWALVERWINSKNDTSTRIEKTITIQKNIDLSEKPLKPIALNKELTPEFFEFMEIDSVKLTSSLHSSGITTIEKLSKSSTSELSGVDGITDLDAENIIISAIKHFDEDDDSLVPILTKRYENENEIDEIISTIVNKRATIKFLLNEPTDSRVTVINSYLQEIEVLIERGCLIADITPGGLFRMIISKELNYKYDPDDDMFFDDIILFNDINFKERNNLDNIDKTASIKESKVKKPSPKPDIDTDEYCEFPF
jgi:hypothetical protein